MSEVFAKPLKELQTFFLHLNNCLLRHAVTKLDQCVDIRKLTCIYICVFTFPKRTRAIPPVNWNAARNNRVKKFFANISRI